MINGRYLFDQPIKNDLKTFDNIMKQMKYLKLEADPKAI